MSQTDIFLASRVPPFLMASLQANFALHTRENNPAPEVLSRVRAIVGGGEAKIDQALMDQMPALEMISICGVGYDGVDVAAAKARGIPVTHTPDVLNDDVADLAIALMLSIGRQLPQSDQFVRANRWVDGAFPLTRKVSGAKLGIVGIGRIGQAIAQRAAAFGMDISYNARSAKADLPFTYVADVVELAEKVDFLVAITPGGAGTRHLINAKVLQALGPQGYLINVARGSVVDEAALIEALQNHTIAGAALDVYQDEPRVPEALRALPNVVLTPHMASGTSETRKAMSDLALANLQAHLAGSPLLTPVPECRT
jgi:lactate dehydrogenase-like 2-hydroxyacid dehydrogenase